MKAAPSSQAGRILALLEQGGWWTTSDLLREVPSIVHSRIADLRAKGYVIEHKTTGVGAQHSLYRIALPQVGATSATGEGDNGGPSAPAYGNTTSPRVLAAPLQSSPDSEGDGAAASPSEVQLALELPARLRNVA